MIFADLLLEKELWFTEEILPSREVGISGCFCDGFFARLNVTVFIQVQSQGVYSLFACFYKSPTFSLNRIYMDTWIIKRLNWMLIRTVIIDTIELEI